MEEVESFVNQERAIPQVCETQSAQTGNSRWNIDTRHLTLGNPCSGEC